MVLDSIRAHGHVIFDMKIVQHHAQGVTPCVEGFINFALILSANDHQKICAAHSDDTDPVDREPLLYACSASSGLPPTQLRSSITSDSQRCAADRSHVTNKSILGHVCSACVVNIDSIKKGNIRETNGFNRGNKLNTSALEEHSY